MLALREGANRVAERMGLEDPLNARHGSRDDGCAGPLRMILTGHVVAPADVDADGYSFAGAWGLVEVVLSLETRQSGAEGGGEGLEVFYAKTTQKICESKCEIDD